MGGGVLNSSTCFRVGHRVMGFHIMNKCFPVCSWKKHENDYRIKCLKECHVNCPYSPHVCKPKTPRFFLVNHDAFCRSRAHTGSKFCVATFRVINHFFYHSVYHQTRILVLDLTCTCIIAYPKLPFYYYIIINIYRIM